jgi:DNA-binding IclR family transcriptional regulator
MTLTSLGLVEKTSDALSYQLGWQIVITKGERSQRQRSLSRV